MYKVSINNQAEIFFPSFEVAFAHLARRRKFMFSPEYIRQIVDSGDTFYAKEASLEKVAM